MQPQHILPRSALMALLTVPASIWAQGTSILPVTLPTTLTSASISPLAATPAVTQTSRRPQVTCQGGQLQVSAQNSSLNAVLREIARCTGMKITGGVAESRVFGDYGPASASTVLSTLLDGSGTNMLLKETVDNSPAELILTPRIGGGPTPPNPANVTDDDVPPPQPQPAAPTDSNRTGPPTGTRRAGGPPPGIRPFDVLGSPANQSPTAANYPTTNSVSSDALPQPGTTPATNGIVDAPNPPTPGSTTAATLGTNFGTTSADQSVNATAASNSAVTNNSDATTTVGAATPSTSAPASSPNSASASTDTSTSSGSAAGSSGATTTQTSPNGVPTPEQILQELQQLKQQQQQTTTPPDGTL